MNQDVIEAMVEVFKKHDLPDKQIAEILRVCAGQMGTRLVVSEIKNKDKLKSKFEIEQKHEELSQRMSEKSPRDMFGNASVDGQRYILEWVLGQHDSDESIDEILDKVGKK